jgi:hypothetical protein
VDEGIFCAKRESAQVIRIEGRKKGAREEMKSRGSSKKIMNGKELLIMIAKKRVLCSLSPAEVELDIRSMIHANVDLHRGKKDITAPTSCREKNQRCRMKLKQIIGLPKTA